MTKYATFPPEFWQEPVIDLATGRFTADAMRIIQGTLNSDNLPDGNARQQTKASNLLASDIPTNSDFEEFNDTGVVAYAWTGNYETTGSPSLNRNNYRPSSSPFRGSLAQQLISPNNTVGVSIASQPFAVKEFLQYTPSVRAKSDVAPAGAKGFRFRVFWFNSDADFSVAGSASQTDVVLGADTTLSTAYQQFSATVTVPSGAKFARLVLYNWGPSKGSNFSNTLTVDTTRWGLNTVNTLSKVNGSTLNSVYVRPSAQIIDEMTITQTFRGSNVLLLFSGTVQINAFASDGTIETGATVVFQFYKDGVAVGPQFFHYWDGAGNLPGGPHLINISYIDAPSAGSHTYTVRVTTGHDDILVYGTSRSFQLSELP
jgi:hypothetical protein